MAHSKNFEILSCILLRVKGLAKVLNNSEALEQFEQEDTMKLSKKVFMQVTYFLLKSIHSSAEKGLPRHITQNDLPLFTKEMFKLIEEIKIEHPWAKFPHFQKSHFADPRPENDKVVDFLMQLSLLAIHIVTKTKPSEATREHLQAKHIELNLQLDEQLAKLSQLQNDRQLLAEKSCLITTQLEERKQQFVSENIIESHDQFTITGLMQVKNKLEASLIKKVQALSQADQLS